MPLRFVWGLQAVDGGNHLDPSSKGQLHLDYSFDPATPDAQRWLIRFCEEVRRQPFFTAPLGSPLLSNCFMKTFKEWMERPCNDGFGSDNRAPCCRGSSGGFPFTRAIFSLCLPRAVEHLYHTPTDLWIPGAAGAKFNLTTGSVSVVVIEYDSTQLFSFSHAQMGAFYAKVEQWFQDILVTAPPELSKGFFISPLGFYDVQTSLVRDTLCATVLALAVALVVLFASTHSVVLSLCTATSVLAVVCVSVGGLLAAGWQLNVLESTAVTLVIGLSVDFTLHYAVAYRLSEGDGGSDRVRSAVSRVSSPIFMAALTTLLAGVCLLPSRVMAYVQIGTFIVVVMSTSWLYSTCFFNSMLSILSPKENKRSLCWDSYRRSFVKATECFEPGSSIDREGEKESGGTNDEEIEEPYAIQPRKIFALSTESDAAVILDAGAEVIGQQQQQKIVTTRPKTMVPEQQIITLGHAYAGDRVLGVATYYDFHDGTEKLHYQQPEVERDGLVEHQRQSITVEMNGDYLACREQVLDEVDDAMVKETVLHHVQDDPPMKETSLSNDEKEEGGDSLKQSNEDIADEKRIVNKRKRTLEDGSATLPLPPSKRLQRRHHHQQPLGAQRENDQPVQQLDQSHQQQSRHHFQSYRSLEDVAYFHCDSPTIRADPTNCHKAKIPEVVSHTTAEWGNRKLNLAVVQVAVANNVSTRHTKKKKERETSVTATSTLKAEEAEYLSKDDAISKAAESRHVRLREPGEDDDPTIGQSGILDKETRHYGSALLKSALAKPKKVPTVPVNEEKEVQSSEVALNNQPPVVTSHVLQHAKQQVEMTQPKEGCVKATHLQERLIDPIAPKIHAEPEAHSYHRSSRHHAPNPAHRTRSKELKHYSVSADLPKVPHARQMSHQTTDGVPVQKPIAMPRTFHTGQQEASSSVIAARPKPIIRPHAKPRRVRGSASLSEEEEQKLVLEVVTHRRKNSYKKAQVQHFTAIQGAHYCF